MPWLRIVLFLLAIGQLYTAYFGGFDGQQDFSTAIITPAGYAFSIWGIIITLSIIYAIYQLLPSSYKNKTLDNIAKPLSITFLGFSIWIYAAANNYLWTTLAVFIIMLLSLWIAYPLFAKNKEKLSSFPKNILSATLGMYIGWSTAAIPQNLAAALVFYKYIAPNEQSLAVYILILIASLVNAIIGQKLIGKNIYYTGTIVWALVAIIIATYQRGSTLLSITSLIALSIFLTANIFILNQKPETKKKK